MLFSSFFIFFAIFLDFPGDFCLQIRSALCYNFICGVLIFTAKQNLMKKAEDFS